MYENLKEIENRHDELEKLISDPKVISDRNLYQKYAKELAQISELVKSFRQLNKISSEIEDLDKLLNSKGQDKDFLELAKSELSSLEEKKKALENKIEELQQEEDKDAGRDVIVEIRAGTGGQEASLFAADLYRMYAKYAARHNLDVEALSSHSSEAKGFKEIIFSVRGNEAYKRMKFESGVHRVQRVPTTEASGRIHTSTATVAVLVEPEEIEINIEPKDLRIDVFRATGPGGQGVNTTDSAVRITHIPTGVVVSCQDERSQLKNKAKAMRVLRARLLDKMRQDEISKISNERKSQIGSGERSEKIRTYNFPDRRVTDHRIGFTIHQLENFLEGDLDEMNEALLKAEREEKKKNR
ncbi:MAG: peptide chain release factor 1 [Candidatus Omnitrophica bacterium]|nr:peptide chain release factor 1 [Candidatus Omnitrophota bacterium]HOX53880.1 peptide chain release factor 1 [Candidatus Omnitrophota bacterium]